MIDKMDGIWESRKARCFPSDTGDTKMAISISGDIRQKITNALADGYPCFVGTAASDGKPQISMRGSVAVYDGETLCWWERGMRSSIDNIDENPQAIIFYRNSAERIHWRIHGRVTLHASGAERERALGLTPKAELDRDPERTGVAALMRVESITELSGNVLQSA